MPSSYDYRTDYVSVTTESGKSGQKSLKRKSSCLTRCLCLLLILSLLAITALVALLVYTNFEHDDTSPNNNRGKEICNTPSCVQAASHILSTMDQSVDPCDDFYSYSCGGWMKRQLIPVYRSDYTTFSELTEAVDIQLKNLLEESPVAGEHPAIHQARNLYQSCKDDEILKSRGDQHFKDWIQAEFGTWPLISNETWDESSFDLTEMISKATLAGSYVFVAFTAATNVKNSTSHILWMDQPNIGMPGRKYYLVDRDDKMLQAYETYIYKIVERLGLPNPAVGKKEVTALVDFEIELAKILVPSEDRRDNNRLYNLMTVGDVHRNYSDKTGIDFKKFIKLETATPEIGIHDITEQEPIINKSPEYYEKLGELLKRTPNRTLANYLLTRVAILHAPNLTPEYRGFRQEYLKVLMGTGREQRRDITCSSMASTVMNLAVGRGFVEKYFDKTSKAEALEMIQHLQSAFNMLIDDADWMDEATQEVAREKNDFIKPRIGYPENIFNDTVLDEKFLNMTFFNDKYFENRVKLNKLSFEMRMRKLRKPVDRNEWHSEPFVVNAYYIPSHNEIMFPGGILQPPFFHKDFPKAVNYGAIGSIIGHEITHGFDDRGRQYDKNGNLLQWWNETIIDNFKEQAQCLIDQYGNFTEEQVHMNLNGIKTQGENIADNGGVKASFRGYRQWVNSQGKEEAFLPGVNVSNNQLFFISFAQVWCALHKDEGLINRIRTGSHSPGKFRVLGSTQNSKDFAEAFSCPIGSQMNPVKKCSVW